MAPIRRRRQQQQPAVAGCQEPQQELVVTPLPQEIPAVEEHEQELDQGYSNSVIRSAEETSEETRNLSSMQRILDGQIVMEEEPTEDNQILNMLHGMPPPILHRPFHEAAPSKKHMSVDIRRSSRLAGQPRLPALEKAMMLLHKRLGTTATEKTSCSTLESSLLPKN